MHRRRPEMPLYCPLSAEARAFEAQPRTAYGLLFVWSDEEGLLCWTWTTAEGLVSRRPITLSSVGHLTRGETIFQKLEL